LYNESFCYMIGQYTPANRMSALIGENYPALLVLSRFGIALGFGDKTIDEVCAENSVDVNTFLAVVNLMTNDNRRNSDVSTGLSPECLIAYLEQSHHFFLKFRLPEMRNKLVAALNDEETDLNAAILVYFDNFVKALRKHTLNEDRKIFPYVRALMKGEKQTIKPIVLGKQHEQIQRRLTEFKNVLIKYYPARKTNEINSFLFDVFNCERDLASHNAVEEYLFQPEIEILEKKH